MGKTFFILGSVVALFAAMASCSQGSAVPNLIAPGPADPGGPGQDSLVGTTTGGSSGTTVTFTSTGCGQLASHCLTGSECCSGTCTDDFCVPMTTCMQDGSACSVPTDCCLGMCNNNVCGAAPSCANDGDPCGATVTCCDTSETCGDSVCCVSAGGDCSSNGCCIGFACDSSTETCN